MRFRKAILGVLVAGSILLGLLSRLGVLALEMVQGEETAVSTSLHRGQAPYSVGGVHLVGIRDLLIDGDTPMEMTLWYPVSNLGNHETTITYPYEIKMFDSPGAIAISTFEGQAIRNAPYDRSTGPFPLVVLSPGFAIGGKTYAWLAEHLASYGFVVISPEHDEQLDPSLLWRSTIVRPRDILTVLSYIDEQVGAGTTLEELINTELVAVMGHSYGGYTALAAAGARLDTAGMEAVCRTAQESNDPIVFLCDALLPHVAEMAELAGLDSIPADLWPAWADPRVDAVVAMAGDAVVFGQAGLAEITMPVMAIGGTGDRDSPYAWGTHATYKYVSSVKKVEIALEGAEHFIFTAPCEVVRRFMKIVPNDFCTDPVWDRNIAHLLISHFTTAFLLAELKQDPVAAAALMLMANEQFPGLTYTARGY
jgi:predicted dienelactone hydrolase